MKEVDALVVASSSSSHKSIPPWAESDCLYGSTMYPPMLFTAWSDLPNLAPACNGMYSPGPTCADQYLFNITQDVVRRLEHRLGLE
jgi:hypothetical protein